MQSTPAQKNHYTDLMISLEVPNIPVKVGATPLSQSSLPA
jgi:hypothetical protein